jgi:hypothetical protein
MEHVGKSVRRKFERDKDELRAFGIPLETVSYSINRGLEEAQGYRLSKKNFYLPYLKLLKEEGEAGAEGPPRLPRPSPAVIGSSSKIPWASGSRGPCLRAVIR